METINVSIDTLTPFPGNPRRGNVDAIAESLEANGQFRPIVVQAGTNYIIAGNHTVQAAEKLGWAEVAAWVLDVDDEQAKRILLADNRTSDLGYYDDGDLLGILTDFGADLGGTGYALDDLTDLKNLAGFADIDPQGTPNPISFLDEEGVYRKKNSEELFDDYAAKTVRTIILAYPLTEYQDVTGLLSQAREKAGADNNADAVLRALTAYLGE
jgi:hypothetical protein